MLKLLEKLRRSPEHNRFALIGTVDRDLAKRFLIGKGRTLVASDSGELSSSRTTIPSGADRCRRAD